MTAGLVIAAQPTLASKNKPASVPTEPPAAGNQSAVTGGALFGGNVPLIRETPRLGRRLAIIRIYAHIGDAFPGVNRPFLAAGSTALVSMDSNGISYAAIAAGLDDGPIMSFLRSVDQAAIKYHLPAIYVSFEHEPDNPKHFPLGRPWEFVQAWDHVHHLAEAGHLDWKSGGRLHWIWIVLHSAFARGLATQFWPGVYEVAGIGVDGYDSIDCQPPTNGWHIPPPSTPNTIFNPAIRFAESMGGLPVFISEWGGDNQGPAGAQPGFIRQMQSYVTHNREIAAALYWDSSGPTCHYTLDNPAALAAMATMARSSALQGHITAPSRWRECWPISPATAQPAQLFRTSTCRHAVGTPAAARSSAPPSRWRTTWPTSPATTVPAQLFRAVQWARTR